MIKFLFTCLFYTTVARWGYAEMSLMFPSAMPYVNQTLARVQIPTHNNWGRNTVEDYVQQIGDKLEEAAQAIEDIQEFVAERQGR